MSTLAALALALPLVGFALVPAPVFAQVAGDGAEDGAETDGAEAEAEPEAEPAAEPTEVAPADEAAEPAPEPVSIPTAEETAAAAEPEAEPEPATGADDMAAYAAQLRQRQEIAGIHRAFGIATWGSMLVTVVLGLIQYNNLYGWFGSREDTPCVQGNAVFGQEQCWGVPWPHRIAALTTTALYGTTFALSFMMPDPDNLSSGNSDFARRLELHKTLRWVHLAGMVAQIFLGFATAQNWFGIDRANDFAAQQALATVHNVIGLTTFGVLTAAGAIMIF